MPQTPCSSSASVASVDPRSGFCSETKSFHSLRPAVSLPPQSHHLSITHYVISLLHSRSARIPPSPTGALIDAASGHRITFSQFLLQSEALAASLCRSFPSLSGGATAFILSPSSLHIPVLYFALLSLGAVISPANPLSTPSEISHLLSLSNPCIAFATRATASKIPSLPLGTVLLDSPEFQSMTTAVEEDSGNTALNQIRVSQSDPAAILFSSGTTGRVKGVLLTHRNFIALIAGHFHNRKPRKESRPHLVTLFTLPLFHIYGLCMLMRGVALGDTSVIMERFDFAEMLRAVEKYQVAFMPVSPPLVVAMAKLDIVKKFDLSSLEAIGCGGAPLGEDAVQRFTARFPDVELSQGYGLTETGGGVSRTIGMEEGKRCGSVGLLCENTEARIVDPVSGNALLPGQRGELWLRGPALMKGYVGDDEATAATLDPEGWLKTGDLCYFDSEGFLYIVDRLKELIKYKAYQVPPAELEQLLLSNPEVADAAVVPYPDEEAGEIPMAFVVREPGTNISEAQVMNYVAEKVAPYKKIRRVAFISSIPKSPAGKILRRELVNQVNLDLSSRL